MIGLLRDALGPRDPAASYGLLAQFKTAHDLYHACEGVRDAGFSRWDSHSPFPVHGLDKAMGLKPSPLPYFVFFAAIAGAGGALLLQWWTSAVAYPLVISGKPLFSWPAFIPITFELGVLCGAFASFLAMLGLNQLPRHHHPLFASARFERVTDDGMFISIESSDPKFDDDATRRLLESLGATSVERIAA